MMFHAGVCVTTGQEVCVTLTAEQHALYVELTEGQRKRFVEMLRDYGKRGRWVELEKLLRNALPYVIEARTSPERVKPNRNGTYSVTGRHGSYTVDARVPSCTCPLFRGAPPYAGRAGVCSHIMTVRLVAAE